MSFGHEKKVVSAAQFVESCLDANLRELRTPFVSNIMARITGKWLMGKIRLVSYFIFFRLANSRLNNNAGFRFQVFRIIFFQSSEIKLMYVSFSGR